MWRRWPWWRCCCAWRPRSIRPGARHACCRLRRCAMTDAVLSARGVTRSFREGGGALVVLSEAELAVGAGERVAIVGASGSGKTTLLQVLGGLDRPDAGTVEVAGRDIHALPERARCELRNRQLG